MAAQEIQDSLATGKHSYSRYIWRSLTLHILTNIIMFRFYPFCILINPELSLLYISVLYLLKYFGKTDLTHHFFMITPTSFDSSFCSSVTSYTPARTLVSEVPLNCNATSSGDVAETLS